MSDLAKYRSEYFEIVLDYWQSQNWYHGFPTLAGFNLAGIKEIDENGLTLEFRKDCGLYFRFKRGQVLTAVQAAIKGQNVFDLFPAFSRDEALEFVEHCLEFPCGWISEFEGPKSDPMTHDLAHFSLPLKDADGTIRNVFTLPNQPMTARMLPAVALYWQHLRTVRYVPVDSGRRERSR